MYRLLFLVLLFAGCAPDSTINENFCKECEQISESNLYEADLKCEGYANNYPNGVRVDVTIPLGEYCGTKYFELLKIQPMTKTTKNKCGYNVTTTVSIRCK